MSAWPESYIVGQPLGILRALQQNREHDGFMKRVLGLTAVVTVVLTGCSTPLAPADSAHYPVGTSAHTIDVDGTARDYLVTVPANRSAESPLVLMLHGGFGGSHQARESYGWNAGAGCRDEPGRNNTDDVGFAGAMLAYRLACDTEVFAAIAPVAGTLLGNCDEPTATSVLHIHGEADTRVRLDGEPGEGASKVDGPPIAETLCLSGCDGNHLGVFRIASRPEVTASGGDCLPVAYTGAQSLTRPLGM